MDEQTVQPNNTSAGTPGNLAPVSPSPSGGPSPTLPASGQPGTAGSGSRMWLIVVAAVVVVAAIGVALYLMNHKSTPTSQTVTQQTIAPAVVSITANGFVPATVSVKINQAVVWTNADSHLHGVASDPYPTDDTLPGLNSGATQLTLHDRYSYIFKTAGTYTYHDTQHPSVTGTVIVK